MNWNIDPILFEIGFIEIRWYGLFFMFGLLLGIWTMERNFRVRGFPQEHASAIAIWMPVGLILGAHLLHLVFYEPEAFFNNQIRILEIGKGLASHGGALGTLLALYLYCRRKKVRWLAYADAIMVGAAWIITFVRIGNFFNSEIVGRRTDVAWAVTFERVDQFPRHPSQLYETLLGFFVLGLSFWMFENRKRFKQGQVFAGATTVYFIGRLCVEYFKEYQTLDPNFPFTMGQLLSMPLILSFIGLYVWLGRNAPEADAPASIGGKKKKRKKKVAAKPKEKIAPAADGSEPSAEAADEGESKAKQKAKRKAKRKKK